MAARDAMRAMLEQLMGPTTAGLNLDVDVEMEDGGGERLPAHAVLRRRG